MAVSVFSVGSWLEITATGTTYTLPSSADGDRFVMYVTYKDRNVTSSVSGWTEHETHTDGAVASGAGVGSMRSKFFYLDRVSGAPSNPTITLGGAVIGAVIVYVLRKGASDTWDSPLADTPATAIDVNLSWTTTETISSAGASAPPVALTEDVKNGSIVICGIGIRDDVATLTRSTSGIDDAGGLITWNGNYVENPATHFSTTTGNDMSADIGYRLVTTGTTSAVTLRTRGTLDVAETGSAVFFVQGVTTSGGTTFTKDVSGGITPAGALSNTKIPGTPAEPTIEGVGAMVTAVSTSPLNVPLPSITILEGDLILIRCTGRHNGNVFTASGYDSLLGGNVGPGGTRLDVLYEWAAGGESGNVSVANAEPLNGWSANTVVIRGLAGPGNPNDVTPQFGTGTAITMVGESITPVTDGCLILGVWASADDNQHGSPASGTLVFGGSSYSTADGANHASSMTSQVQTTAAAIDTDTMQQGANGADAYVRVAFALKPGVGGGAVTYTKSVTGGLTPAGADAFRLNRTFTGALSGGQITTGTYSKRLNRTLTGSFSAGQITTGTLRRLPAFTIEGTVTPSGVHRKLPAFTIEGTVVPAGSVAKRQPKSIAGALTPTGALAKSLLRRFTGSVTPSAAAIAFVQARVKLLSGAVTPVGAVLKLTARALSGVVTPTGVPSMLAVKLKAVTGTIVPAGALRRLPAFTIEGTVVPAGAIGRSLSRTFTAALVPTGVLRKALSRSLSGALTPTGALAAIGLKARSFAGTIVPAGAVLRASTRSFAGTVTPSAVILRATIKRFTGTVTPSAIPIVKIAVKTVAYSGAVGLSGSLLNRTGRTLTASIASAGVLARQMNKRLTAALLPTGALAQVKTKAPIFLTGTISSIGTLYKRTGRALTAALAPTGNITRQTVKRFTATVTTAGAYTKLKIIPPLFVGGTIAAAGTIRRAIAQRLTATIGLIGTIAKRSPKLLAGVFGSHGTLTQTVIAPGLSIERLIALRSLLANADPSITRVDLSGEQPFTFNADTLYLWEITLDESPVPMNRQTFGYLAVVGVPDRLEQARQISDETISDALDVRAGLLLAALRSNQQADKWDYLSAWVDTHYLTTYGVRGFALRITGWEVG